MNPRITIAVAVTLAASLVLTARTAWRPLPAAAGSSAGPAAASSPPSSDPRRGAPRATGIADGSADAARDASAAGRPTSRDDDLRTYAYVGTDLAALQDGLARTVTDAEALAGAADSWSLAQIRTGAERLLADARALAERAGSATGRIQPLAPGSATLSRVRSDALAAYALAADQAYTAIGLAEFAISLDVSRAATVAENIEALGRGGDGLTASFGTIAAALEQWAIANPSAADAAVSRYS